MGELSDYILNGDMCQYCGELLYGQGYPQTCSDCADEPPERVKCPICNKTVKKIGLNQHKKAVHNV